MGHSHSYSSSDLEPVADLDHALTLMRAGPHLVLRCVRECASSADLAGFVARFKDRFGLALPRVATLYGYNVESSQTGRPLLNLFSEYDERTMLQELKSRSATRRHFSEAELWQITKVLLSFAEKAVPLYPPPDISVRNLLYPKLKLVDNQVLSHPALQSQVPPSRQILTTLLEATQLGEIPSLDEEYFQVILESVRPRYSGEFISMLSALARGEMPDLGKLSF